MLVLSGRFPRRGAHGDQIRAWQTVRALASSHEVTVLSGEPAPSSEASAALERLARVTVLAPSRPRRAAGALAALTRAQPAQCGWMTPGGTWRRARDLADGADVVVAITTRTIRGRLPAPLVIDHVDALSFNMSQRARGDESLPVRAVAVLEAVLMKGWERRLARSAAAQIATSPDVARMLAPNPPVEVIPIAWEGEVFDEPPGHVRDIDVIFTGEMSYPPNRAGAIRLRDEIMPIVRAARPGTTAWVVGRAAQDLGGPGVEVAADVPDLLAYLRRAKVAVAPIAGAGSPLKTLEAAGCGAAVVASAWALECYGLPGFAAGDSAAFARGVLDLLGDEPARSALAREAQAVLADLALPRVGARLEAVVAGARPTIRAM